MNRQPLLGELPEFKENIENNPRLEADISDIIEENMLVDYCLAEADKECLNVIEKIIDEHTETVMLDGVELFKAVKISNKLYSDIWDAVKESIENECTPAIDNKAELCREVVAHLNSFVAHNYGMSQRDGHKQMEAFI